MPMYDPPYYQPKRDEACQRLISELGENMALMLALIFDYQAVFKKASFDDIRAFLSSLPSNHYKLYSAIENYLVPLSNSEEQEHIIFGICTGKYEKHVDVFGPHVVTPLDKIPGYAWPVAMQAINRLVVLMRDRAASFEEYRAITYTGLLKNLEIPEVRRLYPDFFQAMLGAISTEEQLNDMLIHCQSDDDIDIALGGWYRGQFVIPFAQKKSIMENAEAKEIELRFNDQRFENENLALHNAEEAKRAELLKVLMSVHDFETMYHAMLKFLYLDKEVRIGKYLRYRD